MRRLGVAVALVATLAGGCRLGPGGYRHASAPTGVTVHVRVADGSVGGELLGAAADGILILRPGGSGLVRFPWAGIDALEVEQFEDLETKGGATPSDRRLERLRALSRFPLGVTAEIEAALLDAHGVTAIETWGS